MNETTPTFPAEPQKASHKSPGEKRAGEHGFPQDRASVTPFGLCQCGCGKPLSSAGRGTLRKWATHACRTRAWRRRREARVGIPPDLTSEGSSGTQGELA